MFSRDENNGLSQSKGIVSENEHEHKEETAESKAETAESESDNVTESQNESEKKDKIKDQGRIAESENKQSVNTPDLVEAQ